MYLLLKVVHVSCAVATISGFILRVYWMLVGSHLLQHKVTKIAPHVVDTLFLLAGVGLLFVMSLNPFTQGWLLAKFGGLIIYILLGTIAIKRGPTLQIRAIAAVAAISVFAYIGGVAMTHSMGSWFVFFAG